MSIDHTANAKRWALLSRLLKRTQAGKLKWNPLGDSDSKFLTAVSDYTITIDQDDDREPMEGSVRIVVRNYSDRVVEQFDEYDVEAPEGTSSEPASRLFSALFDAARRQAFDSDAAISDLLKQLGDDD
ncbi:hypothetical protein Mal4_08230 [Maioricimonas rarisocia]|uniref:Uncharacterized protein n=1 Tax=Maioricimonas rarisocia TaxID=2528026 RepID=A0A517Z242_9PLAN|nr:hypothetical protein [Maioricimonas rarisocia]QDU36536.1 hypothetical protein Mal4_08230 [Maioricimonas rarisocia]